MSNKGLKSYTKQLTNAIGDIGAASINVNKEDANLHISLPLFNTIGLSPIELSLIFNYIDREKQGIFGKGFNLNYYSKISDYSDRISILNADGSIDNHYLKDHYKNKETCTEATCVDDDPYGYNYHYLVTDKYENKKEYYPPSLDYPHIIKMKNGDTYNLNFISDIKTITNNKGDVIEFSSGELVKSICYKKDGQLLYTVSLEYDEKQMLKTLKHDKEGKTISLVELEFTNNSIKIFDKITSYFVKYDLNQGRVVSFVDGYNNKENTTTKTEIIYNNKKTEITCGEKEKLFVFFDKNNYPIFEMDNYGNVIEREFDDQTKSLLSESSPINTKITSNNILNSLSLESFVKDGIIVNEASSMDSFFKDILGTSVKKYSGVGSLKKTLLMDGIATDNITLIVWGRQLSGYTQNSKVQVSLSIYDDNTIIDKDYQVFKKEQTDDLFDLVVLGVNAKRTFNKVLIEFEFTGDTSIELGGIQLLKKDFGTFYEYDEDGNPKTINANGNTQSMGYSQNGLLKSSLSSDSTMYDMEYDSKGNVTKAKTSYGVTIYNEYDANNNLKKNRITDYKEDKILETRKVYNSKGLIEKEYDELGFVTEYQNDAFGRITQVIDAIGATTQYQYTEFDALKKIVLLKGEESTYADYEYDDLNRLKKVVLNNGTIYEFDYNEKSLISKIKLNNYVILQYDYDSNGNISLQKYGNNSDAFKFQYDVDGKIQFINYIDASGKEKLRYAYIYDNQGRLISCKNGNGKTLSYFEYDSEGNLIKVKDPSTNDFIKYNYDNLGNINQKHIQIEGLNIHTSFDSLARSKGAHPEAILECLQNNSSYMGTIFNNKSAEIKGIVQKREYISEPLFYEGYNTEIDYRKDGAIPCVYIDSNKLLTYRVVDNWRMSSDNGFIGFWFNPSYKDTATIFCSKYSKRTDKIKVFINSDYKLCLKLTDMNGKDYTIITTENSVNFYRWNFFSLNWMNRDDGLGYDDICEYELMLNGKVYSYRKKNPRIYVGLDYPAIYEIGHDLNSNHIPEDKFYGKITALVMGYGKYLQTDETLKIYKTTKDYIIDNQLVDTSVGTVDFSNSNLYRVSESFDVFPLNNSVISLTGKKPIKFDIRNISSYDRDRTFNFSPAIKRYTYVADGNMLAYDLGISNAGTIAMKAYIDTVDNKQYFFQSYDNSNHKLGLLLNNQRQIIIEFNNQEINTGLTFPFEKWEFISLSHSRSVSSTSINTVVSFALRVCVGEEVYNTVIVDSTEFRSLATIIGRSKEREFISSSFGGYYSTHSLLGQIEMLCSRPSYCEETTLKNLKNSLKVETKTMQYDELGMLQKWEIHNDEKSILSDTYSYRKRATYSKYLSKYVSKEVFSYGSLKATRNYSTDEMGNVTNIMDSTFGSHEYSYDYRGYMTREDGTYYKYDNNGNIIKKGSISFEYDSLIKGRLVSVGPKKIEYYLDNPLNPKSYNGNTFVFEGRMLTRYIYGGGYYAFEYNDQGLRTSKKDYRGIGTKYYYDGDKLVTEINDNYRNDFLYDENGKLYGFIHNKTDKYYYVRDFMQNILGIVDINGNLVVKYMYSAYGEINSITGSMSETIGKINPFRYKGYYFDIETNMYYCKTRYYVPEWCRWLNADNPKALETDDILDLNLFCYCKNNPIIFSDENGDWGKFWTCFIAGVVAVAAVAVIAAVTVATGGAAGPVIVGALVGAGVNGGMNIVEQGFSKGWDKIDYGEAFISAMSGAVTGALGGSAFGRLGNAIGGGLTDACTDFATTLYRGDPLSWETLGSIAISGVTGAIIGSSTVGGQHNKNALSKVKKSRSRIKRMTKNASPKNQIKNAQKTLTKNLKSLKKSGYATVKPAIKNAIFNIFNFVTEVVETKY